jgi:hypothetical protein
MLDELVPVLGQSTPRTAGPLCRACVLLMALVALLVAPAALELSWSSVDVLAPCAPDLRSQESVIALIAAYTHEHAHSRTEDEARSNASLSAFPSVLGETPALAPPPPPVVVGTYACPMRLGNMLHEFLNAWILAIATERAFAYALSSDARYAPGEPRDQCGDLFRRRTWLTPLRAHHACDHPEAVNKPRARHDATPPRPPQTRHGSVAAVRRRRLGATPRACSIRGLDFKPSLPAEWVYLLS